jgi:hypothetical protein
VRPQPCRLRLRVLPGTDRYARLRCTGGAFVKFAPEVGLLLEQASQSRGLRRATRQPQNGIAFGNDLVQCSVDALLNAWSLMARISLMVITLGLGGMPDTSL